MSTQGLYVRLGDETIGPMSAEELKELGRSGRLAADTPVSKDRTKWVEAARVRGLQLTPAVEIVAIDDLAPSEAPTKSAIPGMTQRLPRWGLLAIAATAAGLLLAAAAYGLAGGFPGFGARSSASDSGPAGIVGVQLTERDGRFFVEGLYLGFPAQLAGIRGGDEIIAIGASTDDLTDVGGKTPEKVMQLIAGRVREPVTFRIRKTDGSDRNVTIVRREPDTPGNSLRLSFDGDSVHFPTDTLSRFPGSRRSYEYVDNLSTLRAYPRKYAGRRVAVITKLLFPEIDDDRVTLRLFDVTDSPKAFVIADRDPEFFQALADADVARRIWVVMHVKLQALGDGGAKPESHGVLEEICFLDPGAKKRFEFLASAVEYEIGAAPQNGAITATVSNAGSGAGDGPAGFAGGDWAAITAEGRRLGLSESMVTELAPSLKLIRSWARAGGDTPSAGELFRLLRKFGGWSGGAARLHKELIQSKFSADLAGMSLKDTLRLMKIAEDELSGSSSR